MAIDKMKKVTVVCPVTCSHRLVNALHELGIVELTDAAAQLDHPSGALKREEVSTEDCDRELQKLNLILSLLDVFFAVQPSFVEGLVNPPLIIERHELDHALHKFDLDKLYVSASDLDDVYRRTDRANSDALNQLKDLHRFEDLPFRISDLQKPARVKLVYGQIAPDGLAVLRADDEAARLLAIEPVVPGQNMRKNGSGGPAPAPKKGQPVRLLAAYLPDDEPSARKKLAAGGFDEVALPELPGTVRDHIRELKEDIASLGASMQEIRARVETEMLPARRTLKVLKAFWDSRKELALARGNTANTQWAHIVTGYVRVFDVPRLESAIHQEFPSASIVFEDPAEGDDVPVSLNVGPLVTPMRWLVAVFGLPPYTSFDPSPFLLVNFYLFFGICFSDVGYGLMLTALSAYIMIKSREFEGLYTFGKLLLFGGISTIMFGALLGSFFGNLYAPEFLGAGNPIQLVMERVTQLDPLKKPLVALVLALGIGILNQFYGISLKMYGAVRKGDIATAVCDGLTWLVILPGFVILVATGFAPVPAALLRVGIVMFAAGALGLILTQGRSAPGIGGKIFLGVMSLYGIVGSYGLTAFIGDTMSYSRLLALGLTTSIVAYSFNLMAGLLRPIPYVGIVLFIVVVVIGHLFNFTISVLGAFVHSMRLIFVEFFGRFYEGGGRPFKPLSFDSSTAMLKKPARP